MSAAVREIGQPASWAVAAQRGADRLLALQDPAGRWEGELIWCPLITAQIVLAGAIMGQKVAPDRRRLILHHFASTRRPDGGWGLHPESHSYLFVTTLVYVACRLLGEPPDAPLPGAAGAWLSRHPEGIGALPAWGRFWLSLLGLWDRDGLPICPPELFLLPALVNRLYCHTRYIYLGMAYLTGSGLQAELGPLGAALRRELAGFTAPAPPPRHQVAASDLHVAPGRFLRLAYDAMARLAPLWRRLPGAAALRRRALARCLRRIRAEQIASRFQTLSPVNGILNTLALWADDPQAPDVAASLAGLEAWCWQDERDGVRYAGARSTTWDTAFALQALTEGQERPFAPRHAAAIRAGYAALGTLQVTAAPAGLDEGRLDPVGGWCVGEAAHCWPVSDCTAEAVSALLLCHRTPGLVAPAARLAPARLAASIRFVLRQQNRDGGFGSFERRRGGAWLERLNPSEMFASCMTERSYIECTGSAIRALRQAPALPAGALTSAELASCARAVGRAAAFLLAHQQADGAWPGFWGINFTYATGFALAALRDAGLPAAHPAVRRGVAWLHRVQQPDGGWGEHFSGCLSGRYVASAGSRVAMTSWAVLALLRATDGCPPAAGRGLDWLADRQLPDGDWPHDSVNGVFFGTAMLDYRLYNTYFPAWALALGQAALRPDGTPPAAAPTLCIEQPAPRNPIRPLHAVRALRNLARSEGRDLSQGVAFLRATEGHAPRRALQRFCATPVGRDALARRLSLRDRLVDRAALAVLPAGTLARAYLEFAVRENLTIPSMLDLAASDPAPPLAAADGWFAERCYVMHDLWHVVTGYGTEPAGELCILALRGAQMRHVGVWLLCLAGTLGLGRDLGGRAVRAAVLEAYRRGRHAAWLYGVDWEAMLAEPLDEVRARLLLTPARHYPVAGPR